MVKYDESVSVTRCKFDRRFVTIFANFSSSYALCLSPSSRWEKRRSYNEDVSVRDSLNRVKSDYTENYYYGSPFTVICTNDESFKYICATWMMLIVPPIVPVKIYMWLLKLIYNVVVKLLNYACPNKCNYFTINFLQKCALTVSLHQLSTHWKSIFSMWKQCEAIYFISFIFCLFYLFILYSVRF